MAGKTTVTEERFWKSLRSGISPNLFGKKLPIDKKSFYCEPVIVERFYPSTHEARVFYRDTVGVDSKDPVATIASVGTPYMSDDMEVVVYPGGEPEICPYTGKDSIKFDFGELIGAMLSFKGDPGNKGSILVCFFRMPGEEPREELYSSMIRLRNKESVITIEEDEININSTHVKINGVEL